MRGKFAGQDGLFSYIAPDKRLPVNHPRRKIRELVHDVLGELNRSLGKRYACNTHAALADHEISRFPRQRAPILVSILRRPQRILEDHRRRPCL